MDTAPNTSTLRQQLYQDMSPLNLTPLWEVLHALVPPQPSYPMRVQRYGNMSRCGHS
jgi:gentisate 1,2-dioxygenase